jgi:6-phosphogluconolactonase
MIEIFPSAEAQADAAAERVAGRLAAGLTARGRASLVATGGRSPGGVYDRLARTPLDWGKVTVTLSDERQVAETSADSNARLVRERLLVGEAARAAFLPLTPQADLAAAAPFDATLLGMGEDGHIASLFPGDPNLAQALDPVGEAWWVEVPAGLGTPPVARISLTLLALLASRAILLLINGPAKRHVLDRALAGANLPVAALLRRAGPLARVLYAP